MSKITNYYFQGIFDRDEKLQEQILGSLSLNFNRETHGQFISNRNPKREFRLTGLLRKIFR